VVIPQTALPVHLGYRPITSGEGRAGDRLFGGLDEVSIYNRALSQSEIQAIVNAGSDGKCTSTTTSNTPPVIRQQPTNQIVAAGGTAHFSVTATGSPTLNYQWYHEKDPAIPPIRILGATNSSITLSNVQSIDTGNYFVIVSNLFGSARSSEAALSVTGSTSNTAPIITQQPASQTVTVGDAAHFSVTATGSPTLFYQWYFGSSTNKLPGETASTLTVSNAQPSNAGSYFVVVSNQFGTAISSRAFLTVTNGNGGGGGDCTPPPSGLVGWWPGETNANDIIGGDNGTLEGGATFALGKVGEGFRLDGTNAYVQIPDSAALKPTNVTVEAWVWLDPNLPSNRGGEQIVFKKNTWSAWFEGYSLLKVTIDNGDGTFSDRFQFCVSRDGDQVDINSQTIAQRGVWYHVAATYDGNQSVLYVNGVAEASATPGFALDYDTTPIFIGTSGTWAPYLSMFGGILDEVSIYNRALTASEIQAIFNAGSSGKCTPSTTSNLPPVITQQPTNQTVAAGGTARFSAAASGSPTLNYQWWHGPLVPVAPTVKIIGATNSTLTLSNVQPTDAGNYFVIISNAFGTAVSSNAVLTVASNTLAHAIVQVINTSAHADTTFDVPINLVAKGNENALSFSLYFNSSVLNFSNAVLGTDATNGLILVNSSQAAGGVVGVELALPSGQTFNPGTQQVARVTFHSTSTLSSNSVVTPISFTGKPVALLLSDAQGQSLSATFLNGFVTISSSSSNGLEGDVSPRPSGDGKLNVFDWVQIGRFVAGLDTISNSSEFQRVDCAPRNTLGDGQIKITDWVQAGRYAAGLDPATPAGGPTGPSISNIVSIAKPNVPSSRQVMVNSGSTVKGLTTTVPITIQAQGDEAGLAFSLNFDPTVLKYVSATTGSATSGATLVVNANQAGSGKLALVVALPGGGQLPAGLDEIAKVTFVAIATGNNSVSFADQPVFRSISDANAVELTANYIANSVVVNPQPTVNLSPSGKTSVFSWPAWAGDFKLQSANGLTPPVTWTDVPVTLQTNGDNVQVTVPAPNGQTFYRLYHP
jgi:hypothetical protein